MKEYEEIKNVFGDEVESYMRFNNVKLVKGDFGGFLVPNTKILNECHKLLKNKYIKKYQITDGPLKEHVNLNHKDQLDLPVEDIFVCLYDSSKTCQTLNHQSKISKYHIFNTAKNTNDILFDIMNTVIKSNTPVPELLSSFEFYYLTIVLEKFRKNHKRIHYSNLFKKLLKLELENGVKKKYRENKCKYQISQDHLCNVLCQIYQIVVPKELFGSNGNGKLLKKAISAIIMAPRNKSINLTKYIMKVNINLISWLKDIYSKNIKYVIIAKIFKWVIVNYLIKVLHSQVCVRHGRHANDRFFILLSDWFKMEKKFIKQNEGNHNLERVSHKHSDIVGKLTFLPKYNSLRPILSLKKYKQEVYKLKDLTRFLQQLYVSQVEWQPDNFQNHWKKVQDWKMNRKNKNIVVSSDIASAFDSIKLERLFDILVQLFNKLPDTIVEKNFHLTKKNAYIIKYRKYFIAKNLKIPMHSGTLYAGLVSNKARSKSSILDDLHKFIFHQKMDIRNKRYKVKRGVLQGTAPSSILNDIYYSHIFHQYLNVHLKESLFFRQTDDCLLITGNESDAASALEKKLHCTAFLKLDPCVFSNKTVTVILSNIFQIAQCQAERASILVLHLFNDINSYKDQIIQILLYNNFKLADTILRLLEKRFLSWDKDSCHVDLENELQALVAQAPEGEEARNGERLIQYATENLVTEVLIHPQTNTLLQCIRNLLASFTKHRHIIHAGYTFGGNGSWILQDGTFSLADFLDAFSEHEVQRVLRAYENSVTVDIHCAGVGDWTTNRLSKEACTRSCRVRVNPEDVLTAGAPAIASFTNYVGQYLIPQTLEQLMEPSDVVGNIRFSHPTLYVFPGGQGDAALFGINGFNMLVDGGFARKACFWDFTRHLDRLDAVLVTRINNSNVGGMSSVLRKKKEMYVYPQIGHFFCNLMERRQSNSPDGDKDADPLLLNLMEIGQEMMANLRHINLRAHPCYRDPEPINLYHKVGHGTLDMYVLSPSKDSREVREFLAKWHSADSKLFAGTHKKDPNCLTFPIQNMVSICALLVWQPANPEDTITRILFPGSTPQHRIFEGFERLKHLDFLKQPVCSAKSLSPSTSLSALRDKPKQKLLIDRDARKSEPLKRERKDLPEAKSIAKVSEESPKASPIIPTKTQQPKVESKARKLVENKKVEAEAKENKRTEKEAREKKEVRKEAREKQEKLEKHEKVEKPEKLEKKTEKVDKSEKGGEESKEQKELLKEKKDAKPKEPGKKKEGKETKPSVPKVAKVEQPPRQRPIEKKSKVADKKEPVKSSPTTPKKQPLNGAATKQEISRSAPRPRPAMKTTAPPPAKSAKDANNRKVLEQKNIEMAAEGKDAKASAKAKAVERKPISRRPKPSSPSKTKVPGSPAKSTRSTPTASVKSDKDGIVRKVKGDKGTTDSSTVSTPSGIETEATKLVEKSLAERSEDVSLDSEGRVLTELKEEREVAEEIAAVLKKGESEDVSLDSTESRVLADLKEEQEVAEEIEAVFKKAEEKSPGHAKEEDAKKEAATLDSIESKVLADLKATEEMRKSVGSEDMSLDSIESKVPVKLKDKRRVLDEEAPGGAASKSSEDRKDDRLEGDDEVTAEVTDKKEEDLTEEDITAEIEEEDEYLIVEKEEVYTESSVQSGELEPKYVLDEAESEKTKVLKDLEALKEVAKEGEGVPEEKSPETGAEVPGKEDTDLKEAKTPQEEVGKPGVTHVPAPADGAPKEQRDDSGKRDSDDVTKEPSSFSPDKVDSSEKKTSDTDVKQETDKEHVPEKLEESQERISTLESGATTTAPTLPEDERIPLDEIKEDVNEKHAIEEVKEKDVPVKVAKEEVERAKVAVAAVKPDTRVFDVRQSIQGFPRDIVKTPDEVADLPVHEEVDPHLYRMDDFDKDKDGAKEPPTPPVKEQKGVFSFFGKVADKFEKGIDKLTKKTKKDHEKDTDDKSSSKSSSPKEPKPQTEQVALEEDLEKVFPKVGKHDKAEKADKLDKPDVFEEAKPTMADVKMAAIKETATFIQEEIADAKRRSVDLGVKIADKVEEIIDGRPYEDKSPLKEPSEEVPEQPTKEAAKADDVPKEEAEDVEEVKALLEEASKKFKTVKDSLRDSLESLEEKIDVDGLPEPILKDMIQDTLEGVAEKLGEIKPEIERISPEIKEAEKVKFDIPKDEEFEEGYEEDEEEDDEYAGPVRDVKEAFRDVGEVLAGTAGIEIDDKVIPPPAMPVDHKEPKETKDKKPIFETMIPKKVAITEEFPIHEEVEELYQTTPRAIPTFERPIAVEVHEEPCVKAMTSPGDVTSPATEYPKEKEEAMKICSDILHEQDELCRQRRSVTCIDTAQFDVQDAGLEDVCVKKSVSEKDREEDIEEPEISFHKVSPVKAELVTVTPGSTPTSPKVASDQLYDKELEDNLREVLRQTDVSVEVKDIVNKPIKVTEIIEELVLARRRRITTEIVEYIMIVKRIPRIEVVSLLKDIIAQKKLPQEAVIENASVLEPEVPVTLEQRIELEDLINREYVGKNRRITIEVVEEISRTRKVPRRVIIEIIEEIIVKRKILRHAILSASEEEVDQVSPTEAEKKRDQEKRVPSGSPSPPEGKPSPTKDGGERVEPEVAEDVDEDKLLDGFVSLPSKEELIHEERKLSAGRIDAAKKDLDDFEAVEQEYKVQDLSAESLLPLRGKDDEDDTSDVIEADEKYHDAKGRPTESPGKDRTPVEQKLEPEARESKEPREPSELVSEVSDLSEVTDTVEKYLDEDKEKIDSRERVVDEEPKEPISEAAKDEIRAIIAERRESFSRPSEDKGEFQRAKDEKHQEARLADATGREAEPKLEKDESPEEIVGSAAERKASMVAGESEKDTGTVRRMLVTASSEDGGQETEICASGTIHFTPTSDDSLKDASTKATGEESPDSSSPKKDGISERSQQQVVEPMDPRHGEATSTPEDSLDRSPVTAKDSQDDSLDRPEPEHEPKTLDKEPSDPRAKDRTPSPPGVPDEKREVQKTFGKPEERDAVESTVRSRSASVVSEKGGEGDRSRSSSVSQDKAVPSTLEKDSKVRTVETPRLSLDATAETDDKSRSPDVSPGKHEEDHAKSPVSVRSKSPSVAGDVDDVEVTPGDKSRTGSIVVDPSELKKIPQIVAAVDESRSKSPPSISGDAADPKDIVDRTWSPTSQREIHEVLTTMRSTDVSLPSIPSKFDEARLHKSKSPSPTLEIIEEKEQEDALTRKPRSTPEGIADEKDEKTTLKSPSDTDKGEEDAGGRSPSFDDKETPKKSRSSSVASDSHAAGELIDGSKSPSAIADKSAGIAGEKADLKDVLEQPIDKSRSTSVASTIAEEAKSAVSSRSPSITGEKQDHRDSVEQPIDKSRSASVASAIVEEAKSTVSSRSPSITGEKQERRDSVEQPIDRSRSASVVSAITEEAKSTVSSRSPSITGEKQDHKDSIEQAIDKSRSASVVSAIIEEAKSVVSSRSPSITGEKQDLKGQEAIERPTGKSRSASVVDAIAEEAVKSAVSSRSASITGNERIDLKYSDEVPIDKSRSGSIASILDDKFDQRDVSHDITDVSETSSLTSVTQQTPGDRSKSPSIAGDKADLKDVMEEILLEESRATGDHKETTDKSKSPVESEKRSEPTDQSKPSTEKSRSSSISGETETQDLQKSLIDEKVSTTKPDETSHLQKVDEKPRADSRSPSITGDVSKEEVEEAVKLPAAEDKGVHPDRSKSPSAASDKPDDKVTIDRSRSSSIASERAVPISEDHKSETTRSRTPSVSGTVTIEKSRSPDVSSATEDSKKLVERGKSPSHEEETAKLSTGGSKSPVTIEEPAAAVLGKSRSSSIASEKTDDRDLLTSAKSPSKASDKDSSGSRSPSIREDKSEKDFDEELTVKSKSPSVSDDKISEKDAYEDAMDKPRSPSVVSDKATGKELSPDHKSLTSSPSTERSADKLSADRSKSPGTADSRVLDEKDKTRSPSTVSSDKAEDKESDRSKSPPSIADDRKPPDEVHSDKEVPRSRTSSTASDRHGELAPREKTKSPSPGVDDSIRSRSQSIASDKIEAKDEKMDKDPRKSSVESSSQAETPKDRSRSHSLYETGEKTPLGRSRAASLYEDKVPEKLNLQKQVAEALGSEDREDREDREDQEVHPVHEHAGSKRGSIVETHKLQRPIDEDSSGPRKSSFTEVQGHPEESSEGPVSSRKSSIGVIEKSESRKSIAEAQDHLASEGPGSRKSSFGAAGPRHEHDLESLEAKDSTSRKSSIGIVEKSESRKSVVEGHEHLASEGLGSRKSSFGAAGPRHGHDLESLESRDSGSRKSSIGIVEKSESRKSIVEEHERLDSKAPESRKSSFGAAGPHHGHDLESLESRDSGSRKSSIGIVEKSESRKSIVEEHERLDSKAPESRKSSFGAAGPRHEHDLESLDHKEAGSRKSSIGIVEKSESRKSVVEEHEHLASEGPGSRKSSFGAAGPHHGHDLESLEPKDSTSRKSSIGITERSESRKSVAEEHEHLAARESGSRKSSFGAVSSHDLESLDHKEAGSRKSSIGIAEKSEARRSVVEEHEHLVTKEPDSRKSSFGAPGERPESRKSSHATLHEDIEDEYIIKITAEKKAEIEKYLVNEFIAKHKKITTSVIEEIVMIYSVPRFVVVDIIDDAIRTMKIRRGSILEFEDELEDASISPEKRIDVETYILETYLGKNKKITSKDFDDISKDMFVPRCILITIIEEIIVERKLQPDTVIDKTLIEYYQKSPKRDDKGPEGVSKRSSVASVSGQGHPESLEKSFDARKPSADGKISPSDFAKFEGHLPDAPSKSPSMSPEPIPSDKSTQDSPARSEPHIDEEISISEEKRTEVEKLLDEEYIKRGKRITEVILEEIVIRTCLPRYIIIEIIEEIIMKRKLPKDLVIDPEVYHDEEHDVSLDRYEDDKYMEKLSSEELGDTDSRKSSRASDYPEVDDRQSSKSSIPEYPMDYESQFHKAFVGGMTEIRTTHITTLSGKSTPDFVVPRDGTPELVGVSSTPDKPAPVVAQKPGETVHLIKETKISEVQAKSPTKEELPELQDSRSASKVTRVLAEESEPEVVIKVIKREIVEEQEPEVVGKTIEGEATGGADGKRDEPDREVVRKLVSREEGPEVVETITTKTTKIITEQVPEDPLAPEVSGVAGTSTTIDSKDKRDSLSEIMSADVKTIVKTVTTVTGSEGRVKTATDTRETSGSIHGDELQKLLDSSGLTEKLDTTESIETRKKLLEDITSTATSSSSSTVAALPEVGPSTAKTSQEHGKHSVDAKTPEKLDHPTSSVIRELISDDKSYSGRSSPDISMPKDTTFGIPTGRLTPDHPVSPLVRDGAGLQPHGSHLSGRSTPDKRSEGRSLTATPEGFRSGEIIRTIITTTRTLSDEGEIITTTEEVTESTNEKGETVILTEKTDVKVDERMFTGGESHTVSDHRLASNLGSDVTMDILGRSSPLSEHGSVHGRQLPSDEEPSESLMSSGSQVEQTETGEVPVEFSTAAMSSSFYGELPAVPPQLSTLKTSDPIPIQGDFSFKRFTVEKEFAGFEKPDGKKYVDEADLDFEKALMEHSQAAGSFGSDVGTRYTNGSVKETSSEAAAPREVDDKDERKDPKKDPLEGWSSPLGLPSPKPPRKFNLKNPIASSSTSEFTETTVNFDIIGDWGEPLRLPSPSPAPVTNEVSNKGAPSTPKKEKKQARKVISENIKNRKRSESPSKNEKKVKDSKNKVQPVYMDLTYVPHHGNSYYTSLEFFKRVRARYYVFSGTEPSREVYDALLDAKKTWEDKDLEVTMIPTYDTDTLGYWVADNEEVLAAHHIDLSPSASRCTINLQDHETSCSAYRLEF